ncbi:MAG: OsmC family protein [Candidatus Aminicenantes bacterium]|nr:OsmC family protein [Candidatus Aminicenantes bacterium]
MTNNQIEVTFPGKMKVEAIYKGFKVTTDQPVYAGGEGLALSPFDLFLISIATCAGFYFLAFCQERGISMEGSKVVMSIEKNPERKMISRLIIDLFLPVGFPEKYQEAAKRAVDSCPVKLHLFHPPEFIIRVNSPKLD